MRSAKKTKINESGECETAITVLLGCVGGCKEGVQEFSKSLKLKSVILSISCDYI